MVRLQQYLLLQESGFNLVVVDYDIFSQRFHGINFLGVGFLHQEHFSKTTSSYDRSDDEIFQVNFTFFGVVF